jgi:plasmid stabilization system protein ParE
VGIIIHYFDDVKTDIAEAKDWYKNQKLGLEKDFAREVKKTILRLQKNPVGYEIKYRNVRTAFTDIFPYAVHFYIDDLAKQLVIIAIVHQSRNPEVSHKRQGK